MPGSDSQTPRRVTRVIIDADPGIDDAAAILLALASPELDVLGITSVAGNVSLEKTTANSLHLLELAGAGHIPVAAGADRPLVGALPGRSDDDSVHGSDGLGGMRREGPGNAALDQHAVDFVAAAASAAPVTIVAIAP